jgi:hypothetical protein
VTVLALVLAAYAVLVTVGLVRGRSRRASLWQALAESEALADGYREGALYNKRCAEELEEQGERLAYEVALLRSAVWLGDGGWGDEERPGELDVRA